MTYQKVTSLMSPQLRLAWDVALKTGLRVSDIIQLRVSRLHEGQNIITEQKTGKERKVYFDVLMLTRMQASADFYKSDWVFPSPRDPKKHMHRDYLGKELRKITRALKINACIGLHSARKMYALDKFKELGDIESVRADLGHSTISTTLLYIYGAPEVR